MVLARGSGAAAGSGRSSVYVVLGQEHPRGCSQLAVFWGAGVTPTTIWPSWQRKVSLPAPCPWWPERMWLPHPASPFNPHPLGVTAQGVPGWDPSPTGMRLGGPRAPRGWQAAAAGPGARCCRGGAGSGAAELARRAFVSILPGCAAALPAWPWASGTARYLCCAPIGTSYPQLRPPEPSPRAQAGHRQPKGLAGLPDSERGG